jgi:mannose-6-phosphate isomerase-like protein (cupin superfamily)
MLQSLAWLFVVAQLRAGAPLPAAFVSTEDIQAIAAQAVADRTSDTAIRTVDAGNHHVGIGIVYRGKGIGLAGGSSHDRVSEVYQVVAGTGTIVTGGMLVNPRRRQDVSEVVAQMNGPGVTGSAIEGGVRRRLTKGDMIIIPAGTPHGFPDVEESMTILVVRIDPDRVVALK